MRNTKIATYLLLSLLAVLMTAAILTSSTTVDTINNENIIRLSEEVTMLKAEVENLKSAIQSDVSVDPFIGEITMFAGNFAPAGWAFCHGQLLAISQNQALFALLGTTYGGDGKTTFALPDLRGRNPVGFGNAPGFMNVRLGEKGGKDTHRMSSSEMPQHNHDLQSLPVYKFNPQDRGTLTLGEASIVTVGNSANGQFYKRGLVVNAGSNKPFSVKDPYLGMNFIISLKGTFPSRN